MEYIISVEDGRVPVIAELVMCKDCENGVFIPDCAERRCFLRGVIRPTVKDGDFCSWGVRA